MSRVFVYVWVILTIAVAARLFVGAARLCRTISCIRRDRRAARMVAELNNRTARAAREQFDIELTLRGRGWRWSPNRRKSAAFGHRLH